MGRVIINSTKYDISKILKNKNLEGYTAAQGYTIGSDGLNVAIALATLQEGQETDDPRDAVLIGVSGTDIYTKSNLDLVHGNDCTFYDGKYFIAPGGKVGNKVIKAYELDNGKWVGAGSYTYMPMTSKDIQFPALPKVSAIAHISGKYFILGEELKVSVCELDTKTKQFNEFSRFGLDTSDKSKLVRDNCTRKYQGIYYKNKKLYKVFSYQNKAKIAWNDVAVFDLKGTTPSFNGTTLNASYTCDNASLNTFELEGIASYGGNMYVYANVKENATQKDSIYSVTLQN